MSSEVCDLRPRPGEAPGPGADVDALAARWIELWCTTSRTRLHALISTFPSDRVHGESGLYWIALDLGLVSGGARGRHAAGAAPASGSDTAGALMEFLLAAARHRARGRLVPARRVLDAAQTEIAGLSTHLGGRDASLVAFTHLQHGLTSVLCGDVVAARTQFQAALDVVEPSRARGTQQAMVGMLALASVLAGEPLSGQRLLPDLSEGAARAGRRSAGTGPGANAAALTRLTLLLEQGNLPVVDGLVRARPPASYGRLWPVALWAHCQYLLVSGRHEQGLRLVEQAERSAPVGLEDDGLARDVVRAARAEFHTALGSLREAWLAVEPGRSQGPLARVAEAQVLYACGEFEAARYVVRVARAGLDLTPREQVRLAAVEAAAALASGDAQAAEALLDNLTGMLAGRGWRTSLLHLPPPVVERVRGDVAVTGGWVSPLLDASAWVPPPTLSAPLSPRERAILRYLVQGAARTEIAAGLGVTINTVKTQVRSLYSKLAVGSRSELVNKVSSMPPSWIELPDRYIATPPNDRSSDHPG